MGRKLGGLCPFGGGGAGSPPNTMWPGPKLTCMHAKFHLDPPNRMATILQRYRQTERQTDRQDREPSDSIGRTVLQTVAPKQFTLCYQIVVCLSCLCDVGVLWPNGWMDQDET